MRSGPTCPSFFNRKSTRLTVRSIGPPNFCGADGWLSVILSPPGHPQAPGDSTFDVDFLIQLSDSNAFLREDDLRLPYKERSTLGGIDQIRM